jgi:predicted XRE-type DNA-binding protein
MKTVRTAKRASTERAVLRWMDKQLARDAWLARRVDELLNKMCLEQDLVTLRKARGLSQSQLAKILHVSQPRIAKIESGDVNNMELKTLVRYAVALGARVKIEFPNGRPKERAGGARV